MQSSLCATLHAAASQQQLRYFPCHWHWFMSLSSAMLRASFETSTGWAHYDSCRSLCDKNSTHTRERARSMGTSWWYFLISSQLPATLDASLDDSRVWLCVLYLHIFIRHIQFIRSTFIHIKYSTYSSPLCTPLIHECSKNVEEGKECACTRSRKSEEDEWSS